jgi:hypothetical protein
MFDDFFYGIANFEDCISFVKLANSLGYKESYDWRLPRWEDVKSNYPFAADLNFPTEGLMWTDNATSASFTAKKIELSNGSFIECRTKEDYIYPDHFRLYCKTSFTKQSVIVQSSDDISFIVLPFGKMTFEEARKLNDLLGKISYLGFNQFHQPTIEQLDAIYLSFQDHFKHEQPWFWSSSEGGRYNAFWKNMANGEIYACKKAADYSTSKAFSLAVVA